MPRITVFVCPSAKHHGKLKISVCSVICDVLLVHGSSSVNHVLFTKMGLFTDMITVISILC